MDVALRSGGIIMDNVQDNSFNPCFSGCRPAIGVDHQHDLLHFGFNPCFSGCRPAILRGYLGRYYEMVSILVLVDVALRSLEIVCYLIHHVVSILVLVDVALR